MEKTSHHKKNQINTPVINSDIKLISPQWSSISEILHWRAIHQPYKTAYIFLPDGENTEEKITYTELDQVAKQIASSIQKTCKNGDRVLLMYNPGLSFVKAFFACLYAGVIAVPAYPPKLNRSSNRLTSIINDCTPKMALTNTTIYQNLSKKEAVIPELAHVQIIDTESIEKANKPENLYQEANEKIAFLQYTSGSTSQPKGVMVTHQNILINEQMIENAFFHTSETIFVSWLPMFHDMGLISDLLQPMYLGVPLTFMAPSSFIQKPIRWLRAISKYKATTSGGPNFAYDLCLQKISDDDLSGLDLSSWTVAYNGAEPIQFNTLKKFSKKFEQVGFKESSFLPCYGLAECTLYAIGHKAPYYFAVDKNSYANTTIKKSSSESNTQWLVSSGKNTNPQHLKIVNTQTFMPCSKNEIGEIWLNGPHITNGYWNNEQKTQETFCAIPKNQNDLTLTYLRTGDFGFINDDNEIFIVGRLKDLIIINGKNFYPQDIEYCVAKASDQINGICTVAISIEKNGTENLVVICELNRQKNTTESHAEICKKIGNAISQEFNIAIHDIVLLKPLVMPKTSSGKLQRQLCKTMYLNNEFNSVFNWGAQNESVIISPKNTIENTLLKIWQEVLCKKNISTSDNFFLIGGTSITLTELTLNIEEAFKITLPIHALFETQTIEDQAKFLSNISSTIKT